MRRAGLCLVLVVACPWLASAADGVATRGPEEAEHAFQQGRRLLEAGNVEAACLAFEQSYAVAPALGTLLNLAACREQMGRFAAALVQFEEAQAWAKRLGQVEREQVAQARAAALEARVGRVRLRTDAPREVTLAGERRLLKEGETSVPVDPGELWVAARRKDGSPWAQSVRVEAGKTHDVVLPDVTVAPPSAVKLPVAQAVARPPSRLGGAVVVGVGGALVLAGVTGFVYSHVVNAAVARQQPGGPDFGNPTVSRRQYEGLRVVYPASVALMAAGGATAGVGVYLLSRPGKEQGPAASEAGVTVGGRF